MPQVQRILDANANRAREALRVMEEAARFILDDAALAGDLKALRHDLAEALAGIVALEAARDTPGDVGTQLTTPREAQRESVAQVVIAAGKRLSEALRALEEYGKTIDGSFAGRIEQLRYRGYDIEHRLNLALGAGTRRQWRLCVLLTESLCTQHGWLDVAQACIDNGADCIQLREKDMDAGELLQRTRRLVELARPHGVSVIVNDRPDVALLGGADGVHLGQTDLPCKLARRLVGRQLLIGVSTHELAHAERALHEGADYCGVGPMFASTTKHKPRIAGATYLSQFLEWNKLPHLAIGGITPGNIEQLAAVGACGVAVSSCVCSSEDPGAVVRTLIAKTQATVRPHSA